tara:strand:- start:688 stop:990 length:303 start_codon:yes stop_codon:yes gene_type:complete
MDTQTIIIALLGFSYTIMMAVWAWHAHTSEKHLREQLERVNLFFDEQMITNDRFLDRLALIENKVSTITKELVAHDIAEVAKKLKPPIKDDEATNKIVWY